MKRRSLWQPNKFNDWIGYSGRGTTNSTNTNRRCRTMKPDIQDCKENWKNTREEWINNHHRKTSFKVKSTWWRENLLKWKNLAEKFLNMKIRFKLLLRKKKEYNPFWRPKVMNSTRPIKISIIMNIIWSPWNAKLPLLRPRPTRQTNSEKKYSSMNLRSPKWMAKCKHFKDRLIWHNKSNRNNKF